jgi:hypothetical protein
MTEKISALVDNACDETESRRVVEEVLSSADAKLQWQRYHLVSALMRGECSDVGLSKGRDDLASKVMEQIADDPPWLLPARKRSASKRRAGQLPAMASGFAVAATLAVVGFVGWQSGFLSSEPPVSGREVASNQVRWQSEQLGVEEDLNAFLVEHGEFTNPSALNGLIAYAKFVSYGAGEPAE